MSEGERLRALFDEDWQFWMAEHPEIATAMGSPGQNARWTDYSDAANNRRVEYLNKSVKRLNAIDRTALDAVDRLNADLYSDLLNTAVEGLAFGNVAMPIRGVTPPNLLMPMSQMEGIQHEIGRTIAM